MSDPRRAPLPPPFPVGTRLRYIGRSVTHTAAVCNPRDIGKHPEDWVALMRPGLEVVVDEIKLGHAGTGRQLRDHDGLVYDDDTGEPYLDETEDGMSVYHVEAGGTRHGRLIRHDVSAGEWEVIK